MSFNLPRRPEFSASSLTLGQVNALVKALGGAENVMSILRGDMTMTTHEVVSPISPDEWEVIKQHDSCRVLQDLERNHNKPTKLKALSWNRVSDSTLRNINQSLKEAGLSFKIQDLDSGASVDVVGSRWEHRIVVIRTDAHTLPGLR